MSLDYEIWVKNSIQKCIEYDELPAFMQLVNKLIFNVVDLAEDSYGFDLQLLIYFFCVEYNSS